MAVDWKSAGRKSYPYLKPRDWQSRISLEWDRFDSATYYRLMTVRNENSRVILDFCIPDYMWQESEPSFYGDV